MNLATIENSANVVRIAFNDLALQGRYAGQHFKTISKTGVNINRTDDYIEIIPVAMKPIVISEGEHSYFINPDTLLPFVSIDDMYHYLSGLL